MILEKLKNSVICDDSLHILKQLSDKSIDLVLTDPPYGIGEAKGKNKSRGLLAKSKDYGNLDWDDKIPNKEYFDEILRVSKNSIIWGGNYFIEYLNNSPCWLVWDKDNGKTDFADCELAWTNFNTAVRKYKFKWQGMLQENMGRNKEVRYHPTQKPVSLFTWCLNNYVKQGSIILDPFGGGGTTAMSCLETNNTYIVIDQCQSYVDISNERIKNFKSLW